MYLFFVGFIYEIWDWFPANGRVEYCIVNIAFKC